MSGPKRDEEEEARPRVRVTDKRRVRADAAEGDAPATGETSPASDAKGKGETAPPSHHAEQQVQEYRDHLQRLTAEFANYRKRVLKEQTRAVEMASEPLMRRLLEVLDEFELALMAAERKPDFDRFLHGVELVYAKLLETLLSEGLERIDAQGQPFDPSKHEALMQSGDGEGEPVVADVLRQGYTLRGRVIRPAGVKVARQ